ncbi:hypothetical protein [Mesorhizobium sp. STM 4661]|uniref:hypothetical protein n=1 Tax=Mesorhizobium sp. STM 4661 TaxID=1297570 RepID=UPI0002BF3821|nr:hypothetical protein [Mesorhizobium sp. STM 4661]CCV12963.1 hypothetical protein MESS4_510130 [Mesorhizobium sp. STM 4661]
MNLRAIRNRDDDFVICHDQPCKKGETNIVAHVWVTPSSNMSDRFEAQFNAPQFSFEELELISNALATVAPRGWETAETAVKTKVRVAYARLASIK